MNVWINGEETDAREAVNVAQVAAAYGLAPNTVLIEHNGVALHQHEWTHRAVSEGDRIEFVRVVAGG